MNLLEKGYRLLKKLPPGLLRLKYPALILALGILLMVFPGGKNEETQPAPQPEPAETVGLEERKLETVLCQIKGAGQVRVLLSCASGETTTYEADREIQTQSAGETESLRDRREIVLHNAGSGVQEPLITRIEAPRYRGAVIVCQGADDPSVRLALTQAVASLTGLGTNQIVVLKMK